LNSSQNNNVINQNPLANIWVRFTWKINNRTKDSICAWNILIMYFINVVYKYLFLFSFILLNVIDFRVFMKKISQVWSKLWIVIFNPWRMNHVKKIRAFFFCGVTEFFEIFNFRTFKCQESGQDHDLEGFKSLSLKLRTVKMARFFI
jgi:hypothetical protein